MRKLLLISSFILLLATQGWCANRYWVGGGSSTSWNATGPTNWGTASNTQDNAAVPTVNDDVFFDGVGTGASDCWANNNIYAKSLNFTGYSNAMSNSSYTYWNIVGNITLSATMTTPDLWRGDTWWNITGTSTITCNGRYLGGNVVFGASSNVTLADTLRVGLNGVEHNANRGTLTLTSGGTFNHGNQEVIMRGNDPRINGAFTFYKLTREVDSTVIYGDINRTLDLYSDITVTNELKLQGYSSNQRLLVKSDSPTVHRHITNSGATMTWSSVDFQDIYLNTAYDASTITGGSGDCGGNTGITFTTADDWYWNGSGTKNYSDYAQWYTATNGGGSQMASTRVPLPQDTCYIDSNSIDGATHIDMNMANIGGLDCTGSGAFTLHANYPYAVYKSLIFSANVTYSGNVATYFVGRGSYSIDTLGTPFGDTSLQAYGGTYTCLSNFNPYGYNRSLDIRAGTFDANDFDVSVSYLVYENHWTTCALRMGSGNWSVYAYLYGRTVTNFTLYAETSTLLFAGNQALLTNGANFYDVIIASGPEFRPGTSTWNSLTINPNCSLTLEAGCNLTVGDVTLIGDASNRVALASNSSGVHFNLIKSGGGIITASYADITDCHGTPVDTWFYDFNCTVDAFSQANGWEPSSYVTASGTATAGIYEGDIVAGGKVIILTLTNDTWVTAGATFNAQRQNIIDALLSGGSETHGWNNEVLSTLAVTDVVRTSDTVVTITLPACADYDILVAETINLTIPSTAVTGGIELECSNSFAIYPTVGWLDGWSYAKKVHLNGESGAGTDFQIALNVGESSGAAGCDFHVEDNSTDFPSAKNDGGDLRFASSDGETLLSFWVESVTGTTPNRIAKIWVKVADDLSSDADIYCYYGKSGASNGSSGDNTFLFFDDFDDNSLNTSKWTKRIENGTITEQNGRLEIDSSSGGDYGHCALDSLGYATFRSGIIEGNIYLSSTAISEVGFRGGVSANTGYKARMDARSGEGLSLLKPPYASWNFFASATATAVGNGAWKTFKITVSDNGSSCSATIVCDGQTKSGSDNDYATDSGRISLQNHYGNYAYFDDVKVRKYCSTEPTFASAALELHDLSNWTYYKKITITGVAGAGTGYQVKLLIGASSSATGEDFDLNSHSSDFPADKGDGGDLIFMDASQTVRLPFWVESVSGSGASALVTAWVKISDDLAYNTDIYCFYGRNSSPNLSDGDLTFLFFDDFAGSAINEVKWPTNAGETVADSIVTLNNHTDDHSGAEDFIFASDYNVVAGSALRTRNKHTNSGEGDRFGLTLARTYFYGGNTKYAGFQRWTDGNDYTDCSDGSNYNQNADAVTDANFDILDIHWLTASIKYYKNGSLIRTYTDKLPDGNLHILFRDYSDTDWVLIRKCVGTEPAFSSAGTEGGGTPPSGNTTNFFQLLFN